MATTERRSAAPEGPRPSVGQMWLKIAITWAVAALFTITVAADTYIGPVVFVLSETHGVHMGDIWATLGCVAVAIFVTDWIVRVHRRRTRAWDRAQRAAAREWADHDEYGQDPYECADDGAYPGFDAGPDADTVVYPAMALERDPDLVETVLIERDAGEHRYR